MIRSGTNQLVSWIAPFWKHVIDVYLPTISHWAFPDLGGKCPRVFINIQLGFVGVAFNIYWPVLFLTILIGFYVGFYLGFKLWRKKLRIWGISFILFGFMNLGALFCHCLLTPVNSPDWLIIHQKYDFKNILWSSFYLLDWISTVLSGFGICIALYLKEEEYSDDMKKDKEYHKKYRLSTHIYWIFSLITVSFSLFAHFGAFQILHGIMEILYLFSLLFAGIFSIIRGISIRKEKKGQSLVWISAPLIMLLCYATILLDQFTCLMVGYGGNLPIAFLGCNWCFVCAHWLIGKSLEQKKPKIE